MIIKYRGELLNDAEVEELARHISCTRHAKERIAQRYGYVNVVDYIENCSYAYFNTDGSINVVKSEHECLVVAENRYGNGFVAITIKENTHMAMADKRRLAQMGIDRR